jgi:hypothetical protein
MILAVSGYSGQHLATWPHLIASNKLYHFRAVISIPPPQINENMKSVPLSRGRTPGCTGTYKKSAGYCMLGSFVRLRWIYGRRAFPIAPIIHRNRAATIIAALIMYAVDELKLTQRAMPSVSPTTHTMRVPMIRMNMNYLSVIDANTRFTTSGRGTVEMINS